MILRLRRGPFTYNYHNRISKDMSGLYAFWLRGRCLYVGKSIDISRRMYQHRMTEHNPKLERYFSAFAQEIEVSYISLMDKSETEILRLENKMIRILRPATNA